MVYNDSVPEDLLAETPTVCKSITNLISIGLTTK